MDHFKKFVPLAKVEEQNDGSLIVSGIVTNEDVDHDGEICDFATSAPLFRARAASMLKLTSRIEGMTPSLMPMREMHAAKAIGAARAMDIDEANKTIRMSFHVVDKDAAEKFRKGVFVGFSQGGSYVKKWADSVVKTAIRYTADPMEVSAVDSPCLPSALVEAMKGQSFEMQKSNGSIELIDFAVSDEDISIAKHSDKIMEIFEARLEATLAKEREVVSTAATAAKETQMEDTNAADLAKAIELFRANPEAFTKAVKKDEPVDVAAVVKAAIAEAMKPVVDKVDAMEKKLTETPEPAAFAGIEDDFRKANQIVENTFGSDDMNKSYIPEALAASQDSYGSFEKADIIVL